MKKVLIGVVVGLLLSTLPVTVGAWDFSEGCCQYEGCCRELCCEEMTYLFRVSYFERVFYEDIGMYGHKWVSELVEAKGRDEAAEMFGREAGYDCIIGRVIMR